MVTELMIRAMIEFIASVLLLLLIMWIMIRG